MIHLEKLATIVSILALLISILSYLNARGSRIYLIKAIPKFKGEHQMIMDATHLSVKLYNIGKGAMWDVRYKWVLVNNEFTDIINSKEEILQILDNGQKYIVASNGKKLISIGNFEKEIDFILPYEISREHQAISIPSVLQFAIEQFYDKAIKRNIDISDTVLKLSLKMNYQDYRKKNRFIETVFSLRLHDYEINEFGSVSRFNFAIYPNVKDRAEFVFKE